MKTCEFYVDEYSCLECSYPAKKVPCKFDAARFVPKAPAKPSAPKRKGASPSQTGKGGKAACKQ